MEKGKLIVIEGTDCSGKETQSKELIKRLNDDNIDTVYYSFPKYDTPTGRIVGFPYLGKPYLAQELIEQESKKIYSGLRHKYPNIDRVLDIMNAMHPNKFTDEEVEQINMALVPIFEMIYMEKPDVKQQLILAVVLSEVIDEISHGWFKEGAPSVDPKVASLYYAADRRYNLPIMNKILEDGTNIVLDRYTYSSMAHQGGKFLDSESRTKMFEWLDTLEFGLLGLPHSDTRLFLHMPTDYAAILKKERSEALDEHEKDPEHLRNAERAYVEIASKYDFNTIECVRENHQLEPCKADIKTPEEISDEVYYCVKKQLKFH